MCKSNITFRVKCTGLTSSASFCVVPVENQTLKSLESVLSVEDSRASCVDLS